MGEDAGLVANQIADAPHQGTASSQHDATIHDVGRQFRGRAFQSAFHRLNNHVEGLGNGFTQITRLKLNRAGQARQQVQATHVHHRCVEFVIRECGTDSNLDVLSSALTHHQVVHLLEVHPNGIADFIASHAHRLAQHSAAKAEHSHFGCTATDVNNHGADGFRNGQASTDCSSYGLIDQMHFPSTGQTRLAHGTTLHTSDTTGYAHYQSGSHDAAAFIALLDEGFEHLLGSIEISDDTITQRTHRLDVSRGAAEHQLGLITHGQGRTPLEVKSHHRGLLQHDAAAGDIDQRVGRSEINTNVARQLKATEQHGNRARIDES